MDYLRAPDAIYAESFATIRREANLGRFAHGDQDMVIRLIHACGMVDIADDLVISADAIAAGRAALTAGKPIICDVRMVAEGIIRRKLTADNDVLCGLGDKRVPALATKLQTTRSAAGIEVLASHMAGSVVAIGNAPTALFHLLERMDEGLPKPALILGFPVGFVGAAESKDALITNARGVPFVTLKGRRGGSAFAAAAVNALAAGLNT